MSTPQNTELALQAYKAGYEACAQNQWEKALGPLAEAMMHDPVNIRYALFLGGALWQTEQKQAALQLWSLAADQDPAIRIAQYQPQADHLTRSISQLADTQIRLFLTQLQANVIAACPEPGRISSALWPQTHYGPVNYKKAGPKPYMFYVPDFPATPVFDRDTALWTQSLEAATEAITHDYVMAAQGSAAKTPYVGNNSGLGPEWNPLKGRQDWHSIHLYRNGTPLEAAKLCADTCQALTDVPLVFHNGHPMEVFFSVLKPGTHIPPHYGLANSRVTVHLPLIIPEKCAIRVEDIEHSWVPGETLIFDDSFDHEACNRSGETRVVLIFEAWRPDMTQGEIDAVERSFGHRDEWLKNRRQPDVSALIGAT